MAWKILTEKQKQKVGRAIKGIPPIGGCKVIRKHSGKPLPFGTLMRGVTVEVCHDLINGKDVVIARSFGPKKGGSTVSMLRGARRRRRRRR